MNAVVAVALVTSVFVVVGLPMVYPTTRKAGHGRLEASAALACLVLLACMLLVTCGLAVTGADVRLHVAVTLLCVAASALAMVQVSRVTRPRSVPRRVDGFSDVLRMPQPMRLEQVDPGGSGWQVVAVQPDGSRAVLSCDLAVVPRLVGHRVLAVVDGGRIVEVGDLGVPGTTDRVAQRRLAVIRDAGIERL